MEMTEHQTFATKRQVWNAGRTVGAMRALKPKQIWQIRFYLNQNRRLRDRALFDLAIDSKLRGCDLVRMKIGDIVSGGQIRTRAIVMQQKTSRPVQFELLADARASLLAWLERRGGTVDDYVFPSRVDHAGHLSTRQYARLVDDWVTAVGLMRSEYGTHSLRRRIVLAAQGFARRRAEQGTSAHLHRALDRLGLFQIDSVNVLARAHYLPAFSRIGRYERGDLERAAWGEKRSRRMFEYRRATVEDMATAHILALERGPQIGFDIFIISAPTPFTRDDVVDLKRDAASVVERCFPGASALYAARGWSLPKTIGRIYDPSRAQQILGFRAGTDFVAVLEALKHGHELPFAHDPTYLPPHADLSFSKAK